MSIEDSIFNQIKQDREKEAQALFKKLIQKSEYIGDLFSINYDRARLIIHDYHRKEVGGIPSLCFLIATRIDPEKKDIDFKAEDSSFILLRVMDSTALPQEKEAERIRVETAQLVSGETDTHWDNADAMDVRTKNYLSFAGLECRIIGTFFLDENPANRDAPLELRFGSDISNYYPNRGLKVYKPKGGALERIVNYIDPSNTMELEERYGDNAVHAKVKIGAVRYASTNRRFQNIDDVPVYIQPLDLLSQKSALFGMTRTGKSNTTKIIAKSVFELRKHKDCDKKDIRIGQIILDPNGEYANENVQDNNSALKNVWKLIPGARREEEIETYGIYEHKNDPDRKMMLINFFLEENLQTGKEIIDGILQGDPAVHIKNFCNVSFVKPDENDRSASTRYKRRVLAYQAVLARAGFKTSGKIRPLTKGLFNQELRKAMSESESENATDYASAAKVFENESPSWAQLASAFEALDKFIRDNRSGYRDFENAHIDRPNGSGERWADEDLKKIIGIFQYYNATRKIGSARDYHSSDTSSDYAEDVYEDLKKGKLVIIDQSSGDPLLNKSSADRVMSFIFKKNQEAFRNNETPPEIIVYIEEAHNILPAGTDMDLSDIWVRSAKEGAKYRIGMVYTTQEVSSIQKNILKNTANWFISHLNNTDETKELCKYYDFIDFEPSIRRAQDKGFLRVKTLSNLFVIPVQVDKFDVGDAAR